MFGRYKRPVVNALWQRTFSEFVVKIELLWRIKGESTAVAGALLNELAALHAKVEKFNDTYYLGASWCKRCGFSEGESSFKKGCKRCGARTIGKTKFFPAEYQKLSQETTAYLLSFVSSLSNGDANKHEELLNMIVGAKKTLSEQ